MTIDRQTGLPYEWVKADIDELREDYAMDRITLQQLEDGLDDVFGINGGRGHASWCFISLPSGACNCRDET